jgi:uncharacterized membrane protein YkvA (DUF1232 family)
MGFLETIAMDENEYSKSYSDSGFWNKVANYAKAAGAEVIERALQLYYASQGPDTPAWAKTTIYAALGYFIFPIDAIPDAIPVVGYADDLGVLTAAIAAVAFYITPKVKEQAQQKMREWFG